jgi:hypothetical protein
VLIVCQERRRNKTPVRTTVLVSKGQPSAFPAANDNARLSSATLFRRREREGLDRTASQAVPYRSDPHGFDVVCDQPDPDGNWR